MGKPRSNIRRGWIRSKYLPWYDEATNGVRFNDLLVTLKNYLPAVLCCCIHVATTQRVPSH